MFKIILISHGSLASGFLSAVELISGKQENLFIFSIDEESSIEEMKDLVIDQLDQSNNKGEEVLILTDLFSASPFNVVTKLMQSYKFYHVTGINLAFLLEVLCRREEGKIEEIVPEIVETARNSLVDCNARFKEFL